MTIEVDDHMIETLGHRIASLMQKSDQPYVDCESAADHRLDGILYTLSVLGIAHKEHWNGIEDRYISAEIGGKAFYVNDNSPDLEMETRTVPNFKMELISKGMFLDQPNAHPTGLKYAVTVYTYRLNWAANNIWLDTPGHRLEAERLTRDYLGIAHDDSRWSFQPNEILPDILTVTCAEKIPEVLPYFREMPCHRENTAGEELLHD